MTSKGNHRKPDPKKPVLKDPKLKGLSEAEIKKVLTYNRALQVATVSLLLAWLGMLLPLPYSLVSPFFGTLAIINVVIMLISGWNSPRRGSAVFLACISLPACVMIGLNALTTALFYPVMSEYEQCTDNAITNTAIIDCETKRDEQLKDWLPMLRTH